MSRNEDPRQDPSPELPQGILHLMFVPSHPSFSNTFPSLFLDVGDRWEVDVYLMRGTSIEVLNVEELACS